MSKGKFLYRDASNYKFFFEAEVPKGMKVGEETTYDKLGYDQDRFHKEVVKYPYDDRDDHTIVELEEII